MQPDRDALVPDQGAGVRIHEGAAAGRQNLRAALQQPGDYTGLAAAEIRLAVAGENLRNGHFGRDLDLGIGINEGNDKRAASLRPTDDLPAPIMPTNTIERPSRAVRTGPAGGAGSASFCNVTSGIWVKLKAHGGGS